MDDGCRKGNRDHAGIFLVARSNDKEKTGRYGQHTKPTGGYIRCVQV